MNFIAFAAVRTNLFDIILIFIFLASICGSTFLVSRKIPALVSMPKNILEESLFLKPTKLSAFLAAARPLFIRARYEDAVICGLGKILRRMRIWIMKSDAVVSKLLLLLQERSRALAESKPNSYSWKDLKDWKKNTAGGEMPNISSPIVPAERSLNGVQKLFQQKFSVSEDPDKES